MDESPDPTLVHWDPSQDTSCEEEQLNAKHEQRRHLFRIRDRLQRSLITGGHFNVYERIEDRVAPYSATEIAKHRVLNAEDSVANTSAALSGQAPPTVAEDDIANMRFSSNSATALLLSRQFEALSRKDISLEEKDELNQLLCAYMQTTRWLLQVEQSNSQRSLMTQLEDHRKSEESSRSTIAGHLVELENACRRRTIQAADECKSLIDKELARAFDVLAFGNKGSERNWVDQQESRGRHQITLDGDRSLSRLYGFQMAECQNLIIRTIVKEKLPVDHTALLGGGGSSGVEGGRSGKRASLNLTPRGHHSSSTTAVTPSPTPTTAPATSTSTAAIATIATAGESSSSVARDATPTSNTGGFTRSASGKFGGSSTTTAKATASGGHESRSGLQYDEEQSENEMGSVAGRMGGAAPSGYADSDEDEEFGPLNYKQFWGWMAKSVGVLVSWQKRFFVFTQAGKMKCGATSRGPWHCLFAAPQILRVEVDSYYTGSQPPADQYHQYGFYVDIANNEEQRSERMRFCCYGRQDLNHWLTVLRSACDTVHQLEESNTIAPSPLRQRVDAELQRSARGGNGYIGGSRATSSYRKRTQLEDDSYALETKRRQESMSRSPRRTRGSNYNEPTDPKWQSRPSY